MKTLAFFGIGLAMATAGSCASLVNLISFGDSYTDDGRLQYYADHNGVGPPAGVYPDVANVTSSGGLSWGQYVAQRVPGLVYRDYAISGASCSNTYIQRYDAAIHETYPSVLDDQVPSFTADMAGTHVLYANVTGANTVYTLWIGTNDLSMDGGFLNDVQTAGASLTDLVECYWQWIDDVYAAGGRRFILFNLAPLHLAPMYAAPSVDDTENVVDSGYWADKSQYNATEYACKMFEYTTSINTMIAYGVPFQVAVRKRWPGATVGIFDVHRLMTDMYNDGAAYLDAPANVTGPYQSCDAAWNCVRSSEPLSSFLWFDELHPSNKTDSIIAAKLVDFLHGMSTYGILYG